jgi:uncharacterized SAM-binding protein YcdF (DUF218 family)
MTYTQPLLLVFTLLTGSSLLILKRPSGRRLAVAGLLGFVLLSLPVIDWLLALPLTASYPIRPFQPPPNLEAVVVLGSSFEPPEYERPYALPDRETFTRCEHAAWISRTWGPLPIVACQGFSREPAPMRELLRRSGVPNDMIWIENRSRSTHENALYAATLLRQHGIKRIALVVDAQSMLRASACFRKEGFDVIPAPSSLRPLEAWSHELLPGWEAIRRNEITLHETLGLAWYWLRGWL